MILKPIKGNYYVRWLHSGWYKSANQLSYQCFENFFDEKDIKSFMRKANVGGFMLTTIKDPVGYVIYKREESGLEIENLVIHEEHRRKGLGTILLQKLEKRAVTIHCKVHEKNLDAQFFFKNQGFRAKVLKSYFGENDAYEFRKALS